MTLSTSFRKYDRLTGGLMLQAGDGGQQYPGLTRRQRDIVCFCSDHYQCHGYPATLREIGAAVGLKSTSSVHHQVRQLQRKGYLSRDRGRPRTTRPRTPTREITAPQASLDPGDDGWTLVQGIGRIAAGGPINPAGLPEEHGPVPPANPPPHRHFAP